MKTIQQIKLRIDHYRECKENYIERFDSNKHSLDLLRANQCACKIEALKWVIDNYEL